MVSICENNVEKNLVSSSYIIKNGRLKVENFKILNIGSRFYFKNYHKYNVFFLFLTIYHLYG